MWCVCVCVVYVVYVVCSVRCVVCGVWCVVRQSIGPYTYALHACLICLPYMHALYVCLTHLHDILERRAIARQIIGPVRPRRGLWPLGPVAFDKGKNFCHLV